WQYLGWMISGATVSPKKVSISTEIKTLSDAQKLVGDLQWVRNIVGITNDDMAPLISLLNTSTQADD
ncbi:POK18 protein, partial [Mionectes macconnelli]|nr:POK18 protein [Mionectes macconnelli]